MNPIFAMLFNRRLQRWHPILFLEYPLPGPPGPEVPVRHKSRGHHTEGFATRAEALAWIDATNRPGTAHHQHFGPVALRLENDIDWDGADTPAMVMYFGPPGTPVVAL